MTSVPEPTEDQCAALNHEFYDAQPWIYFQQRLAHLMFVASSGDRYRALFAEGVTASGVTLRIDVKPESIDLPTPEQSFTAIETEVLLHHSAETLLRFVHAHAEPSPCAWIRMARLTSYSAFKTWVATTITQAPYDDVAQLCAKVFACDPADATALDSCVRYLQLLAGHFLDADSYNAAKHGMALQGGSERLEVNLGEDAQAWKVFDRDGMRVSWLTRWPRDDANRPTRWTRVSRLSDQDTVIALIYSATLMMRSVWVRGRHRHLGEPLNEVFRPVPPDRLLGERGIRHHVLADVYHPLATEGEPQTLIIRSAEFEPPPPESET